MDDENDCGVPNVGEADTLLDEVLHQIKAMEYLLECMQHAVESPS
jgi:hypothetical protein